MRAEYGELKRILGDIGPCLVAFSGGVDSTFLLKVAHDHLGDGVSAVTAISPSMPAAERREALDLARLIGAPLWFVETKEMDDPGYVRNDSRRCYFCKRELFSAMRSIAGVAGGRMIVYGAILDDLAEERPGMQAAAEAGARAPLVEAGLDKTAVRVLSKELGLPTWDKPAMACLASRIPPLTPVTVEGLARVEQAEAAVRGLGFRQVRVRFYGERARVELDSDGLFRMSRSAERDRLIEAVRRAGFAEVLIDPRGYRPGGGAAPGSE